MSFFASLSLHHNVCRYCNLLQNPGCNQYDHKNFLNNSRPARFCYQKPPTPKRRTGGQQTVEHRCPRAYSRKFSHAQPPAPESGTPGLPPPTYCNNGRVAGSSSRPAATPGPPQGVMPPAPRPRRRRGFAIGRLLLRPSRYGPRNPHDHLVFPVLGFSFCNISATSTLLLKSKKADRRGAAGPGCRSCLAAGCTRTRACRRRGGLGPSPSSENPVRDPAISRYRISF